jgi:hypothetical protein
MLGGCPRRKMPPRFEPCLLQCILGILERAQHAVGIGRELAAQGLDELAESRLIPSLCGVDETLFTFFERDR